MVQMENMLSPMRFNSYMLNLNMRDRWTSSEHGCWSRCSSAEVVKGNSRFEHIYFADSPTNFDGIQSGLYEDGDFLWVAQAPDVSDP